MEVKARTTSFRSQNNLGPQNGATGPNACLCLSLALLLLASSQTRARSGMRVTESSHCYPSSMLDLTVIHVAVAKTIIL